MYTDVILLAAWLIESGMVAEAKRPSGRLGVYSSGLFITFDQ